MGTLLLEDHKDIAVIVSEILNRAGDDVRHVSTIAAARTEVDVHQFDLFIFDVTLPDGESDAFLREIREHNSTPAIAFTAHAYEAEIVRFVAAGFQRVLVKPMAIDDLLRTVDEFRR